MNSSSETFEERLYRAKEFAAQEHHRIMLALSAPSTVHLSPTAPVSTFTNLANLSIFNRIYIGSVQFDLSEDDIREAFQVFGPVKSIAMMMDAVAKRHRGYGFIEFETAEAASLALHTMDNTIFGQRHIRCGRPNNYPHDLPPGVPRPPAERLYVSNVHEMIGEDELRKVFEAFGPTTACRLAPNFETRRHLGYGFVEFERAEHASIARHALHRFELAGRHLQVGPCVIGGPIIGGMQLLDQLKSVRLSTDKERLIPSAVLRAAENINASLSILSRTPIPARSSVAASTSFAGQSGQPTKISSVVRIDNLDDYAAIVRSEEDQLELHADVKAECVKFGAIQDSHLHIHPPSVVSAYVKFAGSTEAEACVRVMHGRWFGGRQLRAGLFDIDRFDAGDYDD